MTPGVKFTVPIDGETLTVVYSTHFVQRYLYDDAATRRRAVRHRATEQAIEDKIRTALPEIYSIATAQSDAEGVIYVVSLQVHMVWALHQRPGGFTVSMVTAMWARHFTPRSPSDYEVRVNPASAPARDEAEWLVHIPRSIGLPLRSALIEDIATLPPDALESATLYTEHGDLTQFMIEVVPGDPPMVDVFEAGWRRDFYEIMVW